MTAAQQPPTASRRPSPKEVQPLMISCQQAHTALLKLGKRPKKLEEPQVMPTSQAHQEDSVSSPTSPSAQQIQLTWLIVEECNMTSTGSSSSTVTGTSPMHTICWPMKPIMGGLVQIKSDTFAPNSDWTDLKSSTAEPSSFCEQNKGLDINFSNEKGDLFSFQCKLLHHLQDMGMDSIMYLKDLGDPTKMVNLLMDHTQFTQAYVKTAIEEQHKVYDSYE